MGLTLRWGLGVGLVLAVVDLLAGEVSRRVSDTDLKAAIWLADWLVNLALFGMAGYRVAAALRMTRGGLEAAVLGGLVTGTAGVLYELSREGITTADAVQHLAWNVVLAATAGVVAAWVGATRRLNTPPEG